MISEVLYDLLVSDQTYQTVKDYLSVPKKIGELADLNEQAESMFLDLVKQMAEREGVTELLKAQDQMQWVQRMNSIRDLATEIVNNDLIYA